MTKSSIHSIKVHLDSDIEIRTEVLFGRDWTVVPVVAMVEGVRFGANQTHPELGLASEFGESPIHWNNRPIVLNHPQLDGSFVSANQSADILNAYCFGLTMNAYVDGDKLKMEAWIDLDRVAALGSDFEEIVDLITTNEEMVEVSVGFFSDLEEKKGKFKGQTYNGIWRNIRPDHLAILNSGRGACSTEDGCGIPRINKDGKMAKELRTDNSKPKVNKPKEKEPKAQCACGGDHEDPDHVDEEIDAQERPEEVVAAEARTEVRANIQKLVDQMVSSDMLDSDVRKIVAKALNKKFGSYTYLYGFTSSFCIFERYDYHHDYNCYNTYKMGINVSEGKVEFVGEPEEVILLTRIVTQSGEALVEQSSKPEVPNKENDMTKAVVQEGEKPAETEVAAAVPAVVAPATPEVQAAPKVLTAQEYIAQAPDGVREMLESGMRAHADRKNAAILQIKANSKNKFSDDALNAMSIEVLENLVELSGSTAGDFSGRAPAQPLATQAASSGVVIAPKVFEKKVA